MRTVVAVISRLPSVKVRGRSDNCRVIAGGWGGINTAGEARKAAAGDFLV
jgi:hypothetical protein